MSKSKQIIELEEEHTAHNYHPLPVVLAKGSGVHVWDVEGIRYIDCLAAYSAVNQGHCHPKIVEAVKRQISELGISSRAFHNDKLGEYAEYMTRVFGYEMILPMNTGAEAVETAIKLSRKWAYQVKKVPKGEALVFGASGNFHGRTMGAISLSTEAEARDGFEPFLSGVGSVCNYNSDYSIEYGNVESLRKALEAHGPKTAAFIVEPVQGEAGVVVPPRGYLKACRDLCSQHNVLFIADEIQSGLGRTGKLLACDHEGVKPDVVLLGKALSGGVYPVSAVLANKDVMLCIKPGEHGSTFGGNPVACVAGIAAIRVLLEEGLVEKSFTMGEYFRDKLRKVQAKHQKYVKEIRGLGLMNAVVLDESALPMSAFDVCVRLKENGVLAKPTRQNIIRLTPPLCITEEEVDICVEALGKSLAF